MKKVFFIGDVALDEYYSAPYWPVLKDKVLLRTLEPQMGGSIANAACVYAAFGNSASFLTALKPSELSHKLCEGLNDVGIDTSHMVWDDSLPESKCMIILTEGEHVVLICTLDLQEMEISKTAFDELKSSDYIYSTFCELRPLRHGGMGAADTLAKIRAGGCKVWCDLDVAELRDGDDALFDCTDVLFVNETGLLRLTDFAKADAAKWLFDKGVSLFVLTRAEDGCTLFEPGKKPVNVPTAKVSAVDVTGAGDTFCSAFLHAKTCGLSSFDCAVFANCCAARAVTGHGARYGAAQLSSVRKFAKEHEISLPL